jgi:DnaK suppressor protein
MNAVLSKQDINDFKSVLEEKLQLLTERKAALAKEDPFADADRLVDNAAIDAEALEQFGHERVEAMQKEVRLSIREVKWALKKIEAGTYGVCEGCRQPVGIARLRVDPGAVYCVACETKQETV